MKVRLHHINLSSTQVPEMRRFYMEALGLADLPGRGAARQGQEFYSGETGFVTDGSMEFHLSQKDHLLGAKIGQHVNPVDRGHIAFRTDDIEAVKKHLKEKGIFFSDYGVWGMAGWSQIFFYDPAGNVIEVHQVMPGSQD